MTATYRVAARSLALPLLAAALLMGGCSTDEQKPAAEMGDSAKNGDAAAGLAANAGAPAQRIIALGGPITEVVYALGAEKDLVAVDLSSTYPEAAGKLPKVGYQRTISAESVLALHPGHVIASNEAGPPPAIEQIRKAGVPLTIILADHSPDGAKAKIRGVAEVVGRRDEGERLCTHLDSVMALATAKRDGIGSTPKVIFIYARGAGALQISGHGTAAHAMIALAGGKNMVTEYEGYKPLTPEAAVAAAPDVILMTASGLQSIGGVEELLRLVPALAKTPAGAARRIFAMDDELLLGFGPRTGEATLQLIDVLHATPKRVVL